MKIQSKKISKTPLIIAAALIALLAVAALTYVYAFNGNLFGWTTQKKTNKELTEQVDKTSAVKQDQIKNDNKTNSNLPSKSSSDSGVSISSSKAGVETPTTPPEKPYLIRADLSANGDIKVVATFQQSSLGYCELQLSNANAQTVVKEAYIVLGTAYYSCSFSVPKNVLSNNGQWNILVIHHIGKASTSSNIKTIEVN